MTIPYNEAGQRAFDVFCKVAARLYATAQEAVDEWTATNCQKCRTTEERHAGGKYHRTVTTAAGATQTISYDYETKMIEVA